MIMKVKAIGLLASIMTLCACGSGQMQQEPGATISCNPGK